jgi:ferritin-like metal-binding protein YciE
MLVLWNSKLSKNSIFMSSRTFTAELLGDKEDANLLQMTLEEERAADQKLTKLAKSAINVAAAK